MEVDPEHRRYFVRRLLRWGREHRRDFPWRQSEDPFRILVAEVLLRRSRASTVARVHQELFEVWPDASALSEADSERVEDVIRPAGLVSRAEGLIRLANQVVDRQEVPRDSPGLVELHGVGQYAAAATLQAAHGKRVPTVDAVSARVYRRYFGLTGEGGPRTHKHLDEELWNLVEQAMPKTVVREWNWAVLDLAAAVCLPKRPRCDDCPLVDRCLYAAEIRADQR